MRRLPNPWIAIPSLLAATLAGALGWVVTDLSCRQSGSPEAESSCSGWATLVSGVAFLAVGIGVALVLVLVYRSLAEWQEKNR